MDNYNGKLITDPSFTPLHLEHWLKKREVARKKEPFDKLKSSSRRPNRDKRLVSEKGVDPATRSKEKRGRE